MNYGINLVDYLNNSPYDPRGFTLGMQLLPGMLPPPPFIRYDSNPISDYFDQYAYENPRLIVRPINLGVNNLWQLEVCTMTEDISKYIKKKILENIDNDTLNSIVVKFSHQPNGCDPASGINIVTQVRDGHKQQILKDENDELKSLKEVLRQLKEDKVTADAAVAAMTATPGAPAAALVAAAAAAADKKVKKKKRKKLKNRKIRFKRLKLIF